MSSIDPALVFDRRQLRRRRDRARTSYQSADFLKQRVLEDIEDRLASTARHFPLALSLGAFSPFTRKILGPFTDTLINTDICTRQMEDHASPFAVIDEEWLPFREASFDVIISALSLHWVNDLPGALIQIQRNLKPDGFFVGVMPGGGSFRELRQVLLQAESELTGGAEMRVSPFADALDMSGLLQRAGFALPVSDRDHLTIRYDTIFDIFRDLQATGETHAPAKPGRRPLSRRILIRAGELYAEQFADADGRLRVTLDLVWMTGWAPHASQPKPKRPGSARVSMAEALGVTERSAGEKTGFIKTSSVSKG